MFVLIGRDLQYRAVRFALAIFGTALLFTMVLLVSGIASGFLNSANRTVEAINPGTWVLPEGSSGAFTSYAAFDAGVTDQVQAQGAVEPLVVMRGVAVQAEATQDIVLVGHAPGTLGSPQVHEGRAAQSPGEAVVAAAAELDVGSTVTLGERAFTVVGVSEGMTMFAGTPLVFVDIDDARALAFEGQPVATAMLAQGSVAGLPAGFHALPAAAIAEDAIRLVEDAVGTIGIVNVLLWIVAASVIGAVVYLSALERLRDFAVLKAIGARTRSLLAGLAVQAAAVAIIAAVIAIGLQSLLVPVFPLHVHIEPATFVRLPIVAVVIALLASAAGLRRAVRVDPASAFAGPS